MRRFAAALIALPLLLAACSTDASDGDGDAATVAGPAPVTSVPPPAPGGAVPTKVDPSVAASADAALSGNTRAICAQAERAAESFGKTFIDDLKLQIDAAGKGTAAASEAKQKIARDVENYSFALADMAKLTDDATLSRTLTGMSGQVKALKGDLTKLNADKMSELSAGLDKACGKS
jgi:hypothetical protein